MLAGYYLFPNESFIETHSVGTPMNQVLDVARNNVEGLKGKSVSYWWDASVIERQFKPRTNQVTKLSSCIFLAEQTASA